MNLLITSAPARASLLHFVLVTLALLPALIYGHGHHGNGKKHAIALAELAHGAHLVMETHAGDVHVRPAREALPEEVASPAAAAAASVAAQPVGGAGGGAGNKRVKNNNKKSNKAQHQMQHAAGSGRRGGYKKSALLNGDEQQQQQQQSGHHNNGKQQRQLSAHSQKGEQHQHRTGKRSGAKKQAAEKGPTCRYTKSAWTECDAKTNMRSRTLSLKKGESNCLPTRTMQKACKKACRYEKSPWSECIAGQITREDKLKPAEDGSPQPNCNPVRVMNKKCKQGGAGGQERQAAAGGVRSTKERKHKEKGTRRTSPQA